MKIRNIVAWVALLAGALVIGYEWAPKSGKDLIAPDKRQPATEFTLRDANGAKVNLSDYKDKVPQCVRAWVLTRWDVDNNRMAFA